MTSGQNDDSTPPTHFLKRIARVLLGPTPIPRALRGIVGALVFILLSVLLAAGCMWILGRVGLHPPGKGARTIDIGPTYVLDGCLAAGALIATLLLSLPARRSWLDYGLREAHPLRRLLHGAICGLVLIVVLMASIAGLHGAHFASTHVSSAELLRNAVLWAGAFALVGLAEELLFRGYAFFLLARNLHPIVSALLLSLLFGAAHLGNGGETVVGALFAAAYGLVASFAVWRTGSLWWVFGLHMAIDWSETCLFGVADSGTAAAHTLLKTRLSGPTWLTGGSVGVEGSWLAPLLLCVLAWYIWRRLPVRVD